MLKQEKITHRNIATVLLIAYLLCIPFDNYKIIPISFSTLLGTLLVVYVLLFVKIIKVHDYILLASFTIWSIFISLINVTLVNSIDTGDLVKNSFLLLIMSIIVPSMITIIDGNKKIFENVLKVFKLASVVAMLSGLIELIAFLFFGKLIFNSIYIQKFDFLSFPVLRIKGTYFDPNYFSAICFLGYFVVDILDDSKKITTRITKILFFTATVFSFSRMGIISFILYEGMKAFLKLSFKHKVVLFLTLAILIPIFEFYFHPIRSMTDSIVHSSSASSENRLLHIQEGLSLIASSPLTGYGLGYIPRGGYLHNTFLQTSVYAGIPSLLLLLAFYANSLLKLKNIDLVLSRKIIAAFISMLLIQMLLSYLLIKYLWFFYYLMIQIPILYKNEKNHSSN